MSSLTLLLIVFSNVATASPWPRLVTYLPKQNCQANLDRVDDVVVELLSLLDLSHPLLQRYLHLHTREGEKLESAFHVDLRLLALIYGDQPDLDLRRSGRDSPFDAWEEVMSFWAFRPDQYRRFLANRFVTHWANLDWSYDHTIPGSTVYVKGFLPKRAFRADVHFFWNSMLGRHWDVDDREGVSRRLHQRVEHLRKQLTADADVASRLERRLTARFGRGTLFNVTARVRAFANAYRRFLKTRSVNRGPATQGLRN